MHAAGWLSIFSPHLSVPLEVWSTSRKGRPPKRFCVPTTYIYAAVAAQVRMRHRRAGQQRDGCSNNIVGLGTGALQSRWSQYMYTSCVRDCSHWAPAVPQGLVINCLVAQHRYRPVMHKGAEACLLCPDLNEGAETCICPDHSHTAAGMPRP